jgi:hypothetical protein
MRLTKKENRFMSALLSRRSLAVILIGRLAGH